MITIPGKPHSLVSSISSWHITCVVAHQNKNGNYLGDDTNTGSIKMQGREKLKIPK